MGDPNTNAEGVAEQGDDVASAFQLAVDEGIRRLDRPVVPLLATGFVGGVDVSIGILGSLIVLDLGGHPLLAALAFAIGFISLTLAKSELFTENFLVPIAPVVARKRRVTMVLRLWAGTAPTNLVGGWVVAAIVMAGFPQFAEDAIERGQHFVDLGIGWTSFALAMVGGVIITVMTWMIEASESTGAKMVAAAGAGFLLSAGAINHCVVASLEMFHGLVAGAPFGYLDWLSVFVWAALGNMVGGFGLVTVMRFAQVGLPILRSERWR